MRFFFKKSQRLVRQRDFRAVLSHKCFVYSGIMRLYAKPNQLAYARFGVTIGRKCGTAVVRNRLKRLARQAFRLHQHDIPTGCDYILMIVPRQPIKKDDPATAYRTFEMQFLDMVGRLSRKPGFQP